MSTLGCGGVPGSCEESGNRCDLNGDLCISECDPYESSSGGNPACAAYGYAPGYLCTTSLAVPHCVPPACADYPSVPDLSYCEQLMNGGAS